MGENLMQIPPLEIVVKKVLALRPDWNIPEHDLLLALQCATSSVYKTVPAHYRYERDQKSVFYKDAEACTCAYCGKKGLEYQKYSDDGIIHHYAACPVCGNAEEI